MSVHEKIKRIRHTKGLTQEEVAAKLQMSNNGYGDIERGNTDIKLSRLQKLAELFETSVVDLVNINEKTRSYEQKRFQQKINSDCYSKTQLKAELEKQVLINELQQKEIAMKQREIEQLNKIIALLEKNHPLHAQTP